MGHSGLFLFNFVLFTPLFICKLKKHRCCVGIRTQGWRMVGADGSTELWLHAFKVFIYFVYKNKQRNKAASEIRFLALKNVWDQVPLHLSFSEIAICAFLRNVHCINLVNCFRKHLLNATKFCINWLNVGNVPTTNLINFCRWLDSNRGPLVSEAAALPTEPQPLPLKNLLCLVSAFYVKLQRSVYCCMRIPT